MFIIVLNIFTIVNKVIIALLLWFKKNNSLPNKILSIIVFLPSVTVLSNLFLYLKEANFSFLIFVNQISIHFMAPLIYFYSLLMMGKVKKMDAKFLLNFITVLVPIICWIYYEFNYNPIQKQIFFENSLTAQPFLFTVMNRAIELQFTFFIGLTLYKIIKFKKTALQYYSKTEKLKIKWLNQFIGLMLGLALILVISTPFFSPIAVTLTLLPILSNIFYFYIVYESFNNSVLFTQHQFENFQKELNIIEAFPIDKTPSGINKESLLLDAKKIDEVMSIDKPYLNSELTLPLLAEMTGMSVHRVSEVINNYHKQNFFEYVNCFRIEYAKQKLSDPKSNIYTLESIAEESGFGSKVSFNRAFKKITGITPTEFKKENQTNEQLSEIINS